jgi:hypothetical protein
MKHPRQRLICALVTLAVTGWAAGATAQHGPAPDARAIVLRYLRSEPIPPAPPDVGSGPGALFNDPQKLGVVELSLPTPVEHPTLGWTWLACLRTHPVGKPVRDYALFIGMNRIRDARLSVQSDRCAARTYKVLGVFHTKKPDPAADRDRKRERER